MNNQIGTAEYSYTDETVLPAETYSYRLSAVDIQGNVTVIQIIEVSTTDAAWEDEAFIPKHTELFPVYPNPFNSATSIKFGLSENQHVRLQIFDATGRQVAELINRQMNAGEHRKQWNAGNLSSGIYFIRIQTTTFAAQQKCLQMK